MLRWAPAAGLVIALVLGLAAYQTPDLTPTVRAIPHTVAVFIGDSYTAGAGSSGDGFAELIAQARGWEVVNLGRGGTGYLDSSRAEIAPVACGLDYCPSYLEMIGTAARSSPDIVVVSGGRNDVDRATNPYWVDGVQAFFVALRAMLPDAKIIATSPIWDAREVPSEIGVMQAVVHDAVTAVGGTYVDLGQPLAGRPDYLAGDQVHPNDAGHAAIAEAFRQRA